MFAGHIGVALALGRAERRHNVGLLAAAALLLDTLLWLFVLLGWESVAIPADFAATHQPVFVFPLSHGLLGAGLWSVLAGGLAGWAGRGRPGAGWRVAGVVAAAVFSHWALDALVHRPELPLAGPASTAVGLGLWHDMALALVVEAGLAAVGTGLFLAGSGLSRGRGLAVTATVAALMAFTAAGMTVAPPPPSAFAMAAGSLAGIGLACALLAWLGRPAVQHAPW